MVSRNGRPRPRTPPLRPGPSGPLPRPRRTLGRDAGDVADVLGGIIAHLRLPWLLRHHDHAGVLAGFGFVSGCLSIGIMSAAALATASPFIFPSLGPTAFLFFYTPTAPAATPRNTLLGHGIGVLAGYLALALTGLTAAGPALTTGMTWPRVLAAALSLGLTSALMMLLHAPHPPAGATTLIVSLGLLTQPGQLALLMIAVALLTGQAVLINRLAGIPYPWWDVPLDPVEAEAEELEHEAAPPSEASSEATHERT
jgi:CBS domain-containing membrane protein